MYLFLFRNQDISHKNSAFWLLYEKSGDWMNGLKFVSMWQNLAPSSQSLLKAPILSALGTNLFLDGPSSKSEELTSLLVEDTWDASSFSFSDCSDAGPNPLDWPLPRSPTGEKRGQTLKYMISGSSTFPQLTLHNGL